MNIVILGPQGSGKTTQVKALGKKFGFGILSAGEILRKYKQENSAEGRKIKEIIDSGNYVPRDLLEYAVRKEIKKVKNIKGYIIDGMPRRLDQYEFTEKIIPADLVIFIDIADQTAVQRLVNRGRHDDNPAILSQRLANFHKQTKPVLDLYERRGILKKIDGNQSIKKIESEISSLINNLKQNDDNKT